VNANNRSQESEGEVMTRFIGNILKWFPIWVPVAVVTYKYPKADTVVSFWVCLGVITAVCIVATINYFGRKLLGEIK